MEGRKQKVVGKGEVEEEERIKVGFKSSQVIAIIILFDIQHSQTFPSQITQVTRKNEGILKEEKQIFVFK